MFSLSQLSSVVQFFMLLFLTLGTLVSCSPGPDYSRPQTAADNANSFYNVPESLAPSSSHGMSHWWRHLGDPDIHNDVALLLQQNLQLKEAEARINQAREQVKATAGMFAPMVSLNLSRNRSFRPGEDFGNIFGGSAPPGLSGGGGTVRVFDTQIEGTVEASWQIDLFGQIRTQVAASKARFHAAELDREALLHSLIAELVRRHIALASLKEQVSLANAIVDNRQALLDLTARRYQSGVEGIAAADVHVARQALASVKTDIPEIRQAMKQESYALDVLLGQRPGTYTNMSGDARLDPPPLDVPVGVPAYLLDRRPDLRSAELRLMAENHDIGIAVADLYPSFSITGAIGFEDETTHDILRSERMLGNLITQMTTRLFEGGALRARIRLAEAEKQELVASYARNVLTALQEVETALMQEQKIDQRLALIEDQIAAAQARMDADKKRYESGIISLAEYLESELDFYSARLGKITGREAKWNARINLYLALGGDWIDDMHIHDNPALANDGQMNEGRAG